jgi:glycosyltransferase involved in cell wall biosynthesis
MVFRPDVIIERSARLITAGQVCAQQYGIPYVLEWLDHIVPYRLSLYQRRALSCERQKVANADFIIVVSNYLKKQMQEHGVDPRKIVIAHNAVDTEEFRKDAASRIEVRRKLGIADDEMLAGYLGSYAFYHDAKRLVLAADILRRYKCHKLRILMMGDGGNYNECYTLARKLGLTSSPQLVVKPRVPKEEVPGILSAMDVAVLPGSTDIICPIKVQEYMASELPTVLPDYPANREVIKHGETGLFFTPGNELSLADCLLSLGKDPIGSRKMGEKARVIVKSRFTWGSTWGRMLVEVLDGIEQSKTKVMN